jgi:selenocysteine-specific elongation factor
LFRVRSLQVHGKPVDSAGWGQRVAMNLTGPERSDIVRGHVICHEKITLSTDRFDAFLEVRPAATKGIKNHQRVRVHLGAAERLGKIAIVGTAAKLEPKQTSYCQITLAEPLLALRGDHFIVRDETARRTLAGGVIINPWAQRHKRGEADLEHRLQTLQHGDLAALTTAFVESSDAFALSMDSIQQFLNAREEIVRNAVNGMKNLRALSAEGEKLYTTERKWQVMTEKLLATLKVFHAGHALVPGMDMEELRGKLGFELPKLFRLVVDALIHDKLIAREENLVRLTSHQVKLGGQEKLLMEKIEKLLAAQPLAPPDLKEIEKQAGVPRQRLNEVIRLLERDGSVVRVTSEMYFLSSAIDQLKATLRNFLAEKGEMPASAFRDLIGSSRKYTIPLLEFFDRDGLTIRVGDVRRLKSPPAPTK